MKLLIACEESGTVLDYALQNQIDAYSCDLLPTRSTYMKRHIQGDVKNVINRHWDMVIAFPPCTNLACLGARYFKEKQKDGRQKAAIDFFMMFVDSAEKVAIENPVGIMSTVFRKPDQIIQPYQFGHDASKSTCLWLKGLPLLQPTNYIKPRIVNKNGLELWRWGNQTDSGQNKLPPSKNRARDRSKTYQGIAEAMIDQWVLQA